MSTACYKIILIVTISFLMSLPILAIDSNNLSWNDQRPEDVSIDSWNSLTEAVNESKLFSMNASTGDWFGSSVSLSGNRAMIGAYYDDENGTNSGAVFVFDLVAGVWIQTQKLMANNGAINDNFGYSVSLSGDRVLIGAIISDENVTDSGSVYVFDLDAGVWSQTQQLTSNDGEVNDYFGVSVSLSGDRALIGAIGDSGFGGSAYVFDLDEGVWSQTQKLNSTDTSNGDRFGTSVSLSGDRAMIGAYIADKTEPGLGAVYVFDFDVGLWTETHKLTANDGETNDYFGISISLSADGNRVLIGAYEADSKNITDSGAAYVFDLDEGVWSQTQKLTANDGDVSDYFGYSVSLSGDKAMIGAWGLEDNDNVPETGAAYVFDLNAGVWNLTQKFTANDGEADDSYGVSISLSGDMALIGAHIADGNAIASGVAYVLEFKCNGAADAIFCSGFESE